MRKVDIACQIRKVYVGIGRGDRRGERVDVADTVGAVGREQEMRLPLVVEGRLHVARGGGVGHVDVR